MPAAKSTTSGGDRIDEVLEAIRDLIRSLGSGPTPIASSTGVGNDQQQAARSSPTSGSRATSDAPTSSRLMGTRLAG